MGILCGHWNCGRSFGLGIAEDHGNRNRNDMGVDTGKNPYSVLYGARVYCGRSHYRDISKVIRGLSGRYGNGHGKSKERKKKLMKEAAKKLDFIKATQYRDEVLNMD